jgi:ABC-type transport system substrate-binding protein
MLNTGQRYSMRVIVLTAAFALLVCAPSAQMQRVGEKRTTASGSTVTVYSIAWPTAVSPVSADFEVCASAGRAALHIRLSLLLSGSLR